MTKDLSYLAFGQDGMRKAMSLFLLVFLCSCTPNTRYDAGFLIGSITANQPLPAPATSPTPAPTPTPNANAPYLTSVSIRSSNSNSHYAIVGDSITISFTTSMALTGQTVTIQGKTATVSHVSGLDYEASYTVDGTETAGLVGFVLNYETSGEPGPEMTNVTDSSSVTIKTSSAKPSGLVLTSDASPSEVATPTIRVSGVESNATVKLYSDSCTTEVASATSSASSIDLTSSTLAEGTYSFHAKQIDFLGNESACSTVSLSYQKIIKPVLSAISISSSNAHTGYAIVGDVITVSYTSNVALTTQTVKIQGKTATVTLVSGSAYQATYTVDGTETQGAVAFTLDYATADATGTTVSAVTDSSLVVIKTTVAKPSGLTLTSQASPSDVATPTIRVSGVESSATVKLYSDNCTTEVASGTSASSTIDLTSSALAEGTYSFHAKQIDFLGNTSACSTVSLSYQKTITPVLSAISISSSNAHTGYAKVGDVITVTFTSSAALVTKSATIQGKTATVTLVSGLNYKATYTVDGSEAEGTVGFALTYATASVSGAVITAVSDSSSVILKTTAAKPSGLALTSQASPSDVATPTVRVSGVESNATVKLYSDSCTTEVASGTSVSSAIDLTSSTLVEGTYSFHAKQIDFLGNASACSTVSLSYQKTITPMLSAISISSSNANTNYAKIGDIITISFTSSAALVTKSATIQGKTATVSLVSGLSYKATYTVDGSETEGTVGFSLNYATASVTGTAVTAVTDTSAVVIKTTVAKPSGLTLTSQASPSDVATPTIRVSGVETNATVKLYSDSCITEVASGASVSSSIDLTSNTLAEGTYSFHAKQIDFLGNASACSTVALSYQKTITPVLSAISISSSNTHTGYAKVGDVITISFTSSAALVTQSATIQGKTATVTLVSGLNYKATYTVDGSEAEGTVGFALTYATASVSGTVITAVTDSSSVIIKTTAAKPSGLALTSQASPSDVATPTVRVSGVETNATVKLYSDSCTTEVASGTTAGSTIDLTSSTLTEGTYSFHAKQIDFLGNASACSTVALSYQKTITPMLSAISISSSNANTSYAKIGDVITITFTSSAALVTKSAAIQGKTATVTLVSGLNYKATYTVDGSETEGNVGFSLNYATASVTGTAVTAVTDASVVTIKTTVAKPSGLVLTSQASPSDVATPTIRVSGIETNATVKLYSDTCTTEVASGTSVSSSIDLTSSTLVEGTYSFYAKQTDFLGNVSACSTVTLSYQKTVTPALSAISIASSNSNTAYAKVGDVITITYTSSVALVTQSATIQGKTAPVSLVSGLNYKATYTVTGADTEGAVSFTLNYATASASGPAVTAVTDSSSVTIKTTVSKPYGLGLVSAASPSTVATPTVRVSGVENNATVKLYKDACVTEVASGTSSSTTIDLVSSSLSNGSYTFYAKQIDFLGNVSSCSTATLAYQKTSQPFVSVWKTTTSNESITLPLRSGFTYNMTVDWGDGSATGTILTYNSAAATHVYSSPGNYTITLSGICQTFYIASGAVKDKILSISGLGDMGWTTFDNAFAGATKLTTVTGGGVFTNVTSMANMFTGATLVNPDTSSWDVSNVTDMNSMFKSATSANPDVSNWNTSNVTNMSYMFNGATSANPVTTNWNTSKVTNMTAMFASASNARPDTSAWDVSKVTLMTSMFASALVANPITTNWNTAKVTDMTAMFTGALLANPNTTNWNTSSVTSMSSMFSGAKAANPNTTNWDVSKVVDMSNMFKNAIAANPNTANWVTTSVTTMASMFSGATVANPNTTNWNTVNVNNMTGMFNGATSANPNTTNWKTANVTNMSSMFIGATAANPNTANWNTGNVLFMGNMFNGATSANPNTSNWNTSKVTYMNSMFYGATSANPDVSNWNTSSVTDSSFMFYGATSANPVLSNWSAASVTTMGAMLNFCGISVTNYSNFLIRLANPAAGTMTNIQLGASSKYDGTATTARANLVSRGWTISDGGP